jgi:hypothetical protein
MTTYRRATGATVNRLQALSLFIVTCRLDEPQVLTAARAWANGADIADTAEGRTFRETVRRTSNARILMDAVDERSAWANGDAAALFALFADERRVAISVLKSKGLGPMEFSFAILAELRSWLNDSYAVDAATRESWLQANQTALSLSIKQLHAAAVS